GAGHGAGVSRFLYCGTRLPQNPWRTAGTAESPRLRRRAAGPHSWPGRACHRRKDPGGDCRFHRRRDDRRIESRGPLMLFGPTPLADAVGAILAHSISTGGVRLRKGTRLTEEDCARLAAAGLADVVVARLEPGDLP